MVTALVLILIAIGSVAFYFLSPWGLSPLASNWGAIDTTVLITFIVTGFVFVAVTAFIVYCVLRYRYDETRRSGYEPENKKLEGWLTLITTVGIAALLAPGLAVWGAFTSIPDDAQRFEVLGQQWHWSFRFPGEDGEYGRVHTRFMSERNPFGIDPDDPAGHDDILVQAPRVLLPVDRPVHVSLRSRDVIHNFKVANFRAKMDALPGQMSHFWFTPTEKGEYEALCAQHCGIAHFAMRARVEVVDEETFEAWLAEQPTFAETQQPDQLAGDPEAGQRHYQPCAACHGPDGQGVREQHGPKLAGLEPWYVERQLKNFRSGARGGHEDDEYGQQMVPFAQMLADEKAIRDVAAYIATFPDEPVELTTEGDLKRGQRLYRTCANCHGQDGLGSWAQQAPRLAGINPWYLKTQLRNFREGVRGRHPKDLYGRQMVDMTQYLVDERAIEDVVAYINALPQIAGAPSDTVAARDKEQP